MKITIYLPKDTFTDSQINSLNKSGEIVFSNLNTEMPVANLIKIAKGSEIIAVDPDNFGGFEKAKERLTKLMESLPKLKGVALATTSFGWIDLDYCKKRKIPVSNIPGYSREAVAEHTIALLLCLAKKILITDRRTQAGAYKLEMGFELKGKTLGVIGIGSIGSRTAELGRAIGMKVIAYNRTPKKITGVEMKSLEKVLKESDAIVIHTTHESSNDDFLGKKELALVKKGVIFVNTADRTVINEKAMAYAIKSGKVAGYCLEAGDLESGPLTGMENVIFLKGFGWYTKEAIERLMQIFTDSIIAQAKGKPINLVS